MAEKTDGNHPIHPRVSDHYQKGLTKREEFAKSALNGLLAGGIRDGNQAAYLAVTMADQLIKELNK